MYAYQYIIFLILSLNMYHKLTHKKITTFHVDTYIETGGEFLKAKFILSIFFGSLWLAFSTFFAVGWAQEVSQTLPVIYVWWVIIGIALLPGFLMSCMFFSNLLHWNIKNYPDTQEDTTIIMCAHNEEQTISQSIQAIINQQYKGHIRLLVVDNASSDYTKQEIAKLQGLQSENCLVEYIYCAKPGKAMALNTALSLICTPHFITVDADTYLEKNAVQNIMNQIVYCNSACVAGNLFVQNPKASLITKMQNYDYLLSIASIKRFQGSYQSTLVAQGAFSAYETDAVRKAGGWQDVLGEDIVLTYQLLQQGFSSTYEPKAVGYTRVPETLIDLYKQRKRWAIGMLEGLSVVPPWKQGRVLSRYFAYVNLSVIYLDLAFLFGFLPGVILALFGCYYFVGFLTLITIVVCILLFFNMYLYQKKLKIPFGDSICGFVCFLLFFQIIQSIASLHGYLIQLRHGKGEWK